MTFKNDLNIGPGVANIIIVNDYAYINGGASKVAILSARVLAEEGKQVVFFYAVGPVDAALNHENIKLVDCKQYDLISNPSRVSAMLKGVWNSEAARCFSQLLGDYAISNTIVHFHVWVKSLSSSVLNVALHKKYKVIVTLHDYFTVCPNGGFFNFQKNTTCNLKPLSLQCLVTHCDSRSRLYKNWRSVRQVVQKVFGGVPNGIKYFIFVSNYSKDILHRFLPDDASCWVISNPVDVDKQPPVDVASKNIFTYVGRLSYEKGVILLARATYELNVPVQFIGNGELDNDILLENKKSILRGWCSNKKLQHYLCNSRGLVFPSLLHETQGLAVLEAAAVGVPCIVSDSCAGSEYIEDGATGLIFKSADKDSLQEAILTLQNNPLLAAKMGKEIYRRYWKNPPSLECYKQNILKCYATILEE